MTKAGDTIGNGSKTKILSCARNLFHRNGYHVTSVDDILAQCHVAKSNFYYHFRTKEDLVMTVLELEIQDYESRLMRTLGDLASRPSDRLSLFFDEIRKTQTEVIELGGCPFGNLAAALPERDPNNKSERFRARLSRLFQEMESAMSACIAAGIERGEFRRDIPAAELACSVIATIEGLMLMSKTHRDIRPLDGGLTVIVRLLKHP